MPGPDYSAAGNSDSPAPRLTVVSTTFPPVLGGAEVFLYQLTERLAAHGWRITVLTALPEALAPAGVAIDSTLVIGRSSLPGAWFLRPFIRGLREFTRRRTSCDVLLLAMVSPYLASAATARRFGRCPPFVLRVASEANLDLLVHHRLSRLLFRSARQASAIIVMNEGMARRLLELGFAPDSVHVIPNGVDCEFFRPTSGKPASSASAPPIVGCVSRLEHAKGTDVLLEVIRRAPPDWRWRLIGRGSMEDSVRKCIAQRPAVEWREYVPREEMPDFYRSLDLFFLPSRDEGMSNALLEAMAAGLPCVASDIPANRAFEHALRRVPPGDAAASFRAISELAADPRSRRRLGQEARRLVESRFSLDHVSTLYEAVLRDVRNGKTRRS